MEEPTAFPPIRALAAEIRSGERSARALAEECLARAEAIAPLNAFLATTAERALAQAAAVDERVANGEDPGPLAGVPVAVKDNIAVAGVRMTAGASFLRDHVPDADAPVAAALDRAGAVGLGKLQMAEYAVGGTSQNDHYGDARNPWDPERITGGSSGGSGIATATDVVAAALGSDTGGSIRMPGALCGVTGLRPTYGRVSNRGSVPMAWSLDVIGPMARRAEDVATLFDVIAGHDPADPASVLRPPAHAVEGLTAPVRGLRVGVLGGSFREGPLTAAAAAAVDAVAETLAGCGLDVVAADLGEDHRDPAAAATSDILIGDAAAYHEVRLREHPEGFGPRIRERLERGLDMSGPRYSRARRAQREWTRRVEHFMRDYDVLLCPACPGPAPLLADSDPVDTTLWAAWYESCWSLAWVPSLVMPAGFEAGLPLGAQLVGRAWEESVLLRVAHAYQQVTDWHLRRPPFPATAGQG